MRQLMFVKIDGILFVGKVEVPDDAGKSFVPTKIHKPRMVFVDHKDNKVSLAKCIANPDTVIIPEQNVNFWYPCTEPEFEKFYVQDTTNLILAGKR